MGKIYEGKFEERDGIIFSDLLKRERAKLGFDKSTKELIEIAEKKNILRENHKLNPAFLECVKEFAEDKLPINYQLLKASANYAFLYLWKKELSEKEFIANASSYFEIFFHVREGISKLENFALKHGYIDEEGKRGPAIVLTGLACIAKDKAKNKVYRQINNRLIIRDNSIFDMLKNYKRGKKSER